MGVMLSLTGPGQSARLRQPRSRRHGQHARNPSDQACLDAFAAFLRDDASGAGRCLSRVARRVLAARLLPAAVALAEAADTVLAGQSPDRRGAGASFTVSSACLIGRCTARLDGPGCELARCEHDCHRRLRQGALEVAATAA
jgi:hypothetical protein